VVVSPAVVSHHVKSSTDSDAEMEAAAGHDNGVVTTEGGGDVEDGFESANTTQSDEDIALACAGMEDQVLRDALRAGQGGGVC